MQYSSIIRLLSTLTVMPAAIKVSLQLGGWLVDKVLLLRFDFIDMAVYNHFRGIITVVKSLLISCVICR